MIQWIGLQRNIRDIEAKTTDLKRRKGCHRKAMLIRSSITNTDFNFSLSLCTSKLYLFYAGEKRVRVEGVPPV